MRNKEIEKGTGPPRSGHARLTRVLASSDGQYPRCGGMFRFEALCHYKNLVRVIGKVEIARTFRSTREMFDSKLFIEEESTKASSSTGWNGEGTTASNHEDRRSPGEGGFIVRVMVLGP